MTKSTVLGTRSNYETPSLHLLHNLDGVKILQEIGTNYNNFGIMILNEESGAFISSVELNCNYKAKCIITEIARKWLSGHRNYQETTWTALVETL